jgi:hypothetical protein
MLCSSERFPSKVRTLFALLQRIATVGGNDSNAMQLAYYIAPYLCRRENSAYMSIRHMEVSVSLCSASSHLIIVTAVRYFGATPLLAYLVFTQN